jgi:hypothetical protein
VFTTLLPDSPDALLLPPGAFYPVHYSHKARIGRADHAAENPWAFCLHHWDGSWV